MGFDESRFSLRWSDESAGEVEFASALGSCAGASLEVEQRSEGRYFVLEFESCYIELSPEPGGACVRFAACNPDEVFDAGRCVLEALAARAPFDVRLGTSTVGHSADMEPFWEVFESDARQQRLHWLLDAKEQQPTKSTRSQAMEHFFATDQAQRLDEEE